MYDYNQDDNVGVEAASYAPGAARVGAKVVKKGVKKGASEAHKRTKAILKKRIQRQAQQEIRKQQAKATAETTKQTVKTAAEISKKIAEEAARLAKAAAEMAKKVAESIIEFIVDNPVVLVIIAVVIAIFVVMHCFNVSIVSLFGSLGESTMTGTYTAYDEDIIGVNSDYNKLEKQLRNTINTTERDYPGYDEYEYQLEEIGHNPYELISYLTVAYENFTRRDMKQKVKDLFDLQYDLTYTPRTETRTRTVTRTGYRIVTGANGMATMESYSYEDTEEYTVRILKVKLNNRGLGNVINASPLSELQKQRYQLLLQTQGNKSDLFDDLYTDVEIPEELEVAPEALTDQTFAAMIAEGEKYIGRAYVWGGSNPNQGFDCSGFVCWVLNHSGWSVGRTDCNGLKAKCTVVSEEEAKPGDLIFFKGTQKSKKGATHVGIYCGNGIMLHCGNPIQYTSINTTYYKKHFLCYGRLP